MSARTSSKRKIKVPFAAPPSFNSSDARKGKEAAAFPIITRNNQAISPALALATREQYRAAFEVCRPIFEKLVLLSRKRMEIPAEFFAETARKTYAVLWLLDTPRRNLLMPEGASWYPTFNPDPGPKHPLQRIGIDKRTGALVYGAQAIAREDAKDYDKDPGWRKTRFWRGAFVEDYYHLMPLDEVANIQGEITSIDVNWLALIEKRLDEYLLFLKDGEELTAREILGATNQEIRRALMMRAGYERLKELMDVRVIDRDEATDAELIHVKDDMQAWTGSESERTLAFVKVRDSSTDRIYLLAVPLVWGWRRDEIDTVQKARAWTFGFRPDQAHEFKPEIET